MSSSPSPYGSAPRRRTRGILLAVLFVLIAAAGLSYVKWWPYYGKALKAATDHSIGSSILSGDAGNLPAPSFGAALDYAAVYFQAVWKAAVLGILLGSLLQVLLPSRWLFRVLGRAGFRSTAVATLASVPGMMCSCCAAPIAVGLRKKNVSVGAAMAFWIGNPLLNPATLVFMTFVLSWKFTAIRIVFGLALTFGVSYLANRYAGDRELPEPIAESAEGTDEDEGPLLRRWLASMGRMLLTIIPAYILAVLLLGAVRAWLFPSLDAGALSGVLSVIVFAIAGTLFVIPTAAEIPIIGTFRSFGFGGGVAGALLVTLPAISLPSLLMVYRSFPRKAVWLLLGSVVLAGLLAGAVGALVL